MAVSDLKKFYRPGESGVTGSPDPAWQWGGEAEKKDREAPKGLKKKKDEEDEEDLLLVMLLEAEAQKGKSGSTLYPQRPGPADPPLPKRRGFDTGQEQYVGGKKYDPREQWGSGPFPGVTTKYPDLPFEGFFMTGEEIAKAGPKYDPRYYAQSGGGRGGRADVATSGPARIAANPEAVIMERIVQALEESGAVQKNLLAKYLPRNLIRERSFFG